MHSNNNKINNNNNNNNTTNTNKTIIEATRTAIESIPTRTNTEYMLLCYYYSDQHAVLPCVWNVPTRCYNTNQT